ncbi:MAG: hypothetical protein ABW049_00655 [Spongiibacteraceae bacterium]
MNAAFVENPMFVASYSDAEGKHFLPFSQAEHDRRTWFYRRIIDSFQLPPRLNVLVISTYEDHALTIPLQALLHADGHIPCYAEATWFDARRTENFLRRMDIAVMIGVNSAVLDGLEAIDFKPAELFANRIVFTRDEGAYHRLAGNASITLRRWMEVGPALAMECAHGGGLHIDPNEWTVEIDNGEVLLTNRMPMLLDFDRVRTGFKAIAVEELCDCGRDGVRLLPVV